MSHHLPPLHIECSRRHWPGACPREAPDWAVNMANRVRDKLSALMSGNPFGRNGHDAR